MSVVAQYEAKAGGNEKRVLSETMGRKSKGVEIVWKLERSKGLLIGRS